MRMLDLIARKRDGGAHSSAELEFIARGARGDGIPDYQLASWLMAVRLRGMNGAETVALTRAMALSGGSLDLSGLRAPKADKHSTGGVGDGISLALAPLVAAAGAAVPMMSGRGLGHTGGTLDKLESIPGFKVALAPGRIRRQLRSIGVCMFGQSDAIAPADRKLYALRDATATVESMPLIVASILSKKLAEDLDGLVLDVKCGSGAFLRDVPMAFELGRRLVRTGRRLGLRSVAVVSSMEQPLGWAVGNGVELRQAVGVLRGEPSPPDYVELLLTLGAWMLRLCGRVRHWEQGRRLLEDLLSGGQALDKFRKMVEAQGGDPRVADEPDRVLPRPRLLEDLLARRSGYLIRMDARGVGRAAVALGAGRDSMEDGVDPAAGIRLCKKLGDPVRRGEPVARLYAARPERLRAASSLLSDSIAVGGRREALPPLIRKVIE